MNLAATPRLMGLLASVLALLLLALALTFSAVDHDTLAEALPAVDATPLQHAGSSAAGEIAAQQLTVAKAAAQLAALKFADASAREEVLWLARVIYSETKRPAEQELVAWVVRNRVETGYRGKRTYKDVVLDPWQFSAFNENAPKRGHYMGLDLVSKARGWTTAVLIAYEVLHAPAYERPFPLSTRHFYSEISLGEAGHPDWATGRRPVSLDREIDPRRFRFYAEIA